MNFFCLKETFIIVEVVLAYSARAEPAIIKQTITSAFQGTVRLINLITTLFNNSSTFWTTSKTIPYFQKGLWLGGLLKSIAPF